MQRIAKTLVTVACCWIACGAWADGRLLATGGASGIEGGAGGGILPWAVLAGYGTNTDNGADTFGSYVSTDDYSLSVAGVSYTVRNRIEFSLAHQELNAPTIRAALGLPSDWRLRQNIAGAKVRLAGDIVYTPWPQVTVGAQYKNNIDFDIPAAIGAVDDDDVDLYVSAAKLFLAGAAGRNLFVNVTARSTRANQTGLLGFGGDLNDSRSWQLETSVAAFINPRWAIGAEYRTKPDNLSFAREDDWADVFVAWFPNKHLALVGAWVDLGSVATLDDQTGYYLSLQGSF